MLSILIPSFDEPYLQATIDSLKTNAVGEIEIIPVLDRVPFNFGMRYCINKGLAQAKGEYIMKVDAHCSFAPGFDKVLIDSCQENWLMIPRRYSLDEVNWTKNETRPIRDYHFLSYPFGHESNYTVGIFSWDWLARGKARSDPKYNIDDTMTFQGSCWLANRKYFMQHVGLLNGRKKFYGKFAAEQLEIGLKYWLNDGEVKVNKNTWYAHLHKGERYGRMYWMSRTENRESYKYAYKHWIIDNNDFIISLFEKFNQDLMMPGWPKDFKEKLWKQKTLYSL